MISFYFLLTLSDKVLDEGEGGVPPILLSLIIRVYSFLLLTPLLNRIKYVYGGGGEVGFSLFPSFIISITIMTIFITTFVRSTPVVIALKPLSILFNFLG